MTREELDKKIKEARKRSLLIYQKAFMLFGCMKWNKIFTFISQYLQYKRLLFITVGEALLAGTPTSTESEPHAGQRSVECQNK